MTDIVANLRNIQDHLRTGRFGQREVWDHQLEDAAAAIERLRAGYEAIKKATIDGRVCDDVAWFDTITTLYDFCEEMLWHEQKAGETNN